MENEPKYYIITPFGKFEVDPRSLSEVTVIKGFGCSTCAHERDGVIAETFDSPCHTCCDSSDMLMNQIKGNNYVKKQETD